MKPLLYHLEYHIENGYFDRFPKGQAIKMVIGNDGGVQTLNGRGTGSGRVMFSSGKSVLFAIDKSKDELKVVFRAYSDDKFLGEAVKIFKDASFPKRTEVGEPASFTFASDLGFRKGSDLVGAIKSFIRMTSFGENIISDCIKDGESYRVRMTSLIVERNKDPRKNVKPWWVILDGRRLRFSRWLRALEKEDCTKDVFLKVKKYPEVEESLPGVSETFINEEDEAAMETVEAALKKDFEFIREFGSQETYDKGSQVDFNNDTSFFTLQIDSLDSKSTASNICDQKNISTACRLVNLPNNSGVTLRSSEIQPEITSSSISDIKESGLVISEQESLKNQNTDDLVSFDCNQTTGKNVCDENVPKPQKTNENKVIYQKKMKADDIFHFERSTSDVLGENVSIDSSGVTTFVSEEIRASVCEVEPPIVTDRSFLSETIAREITNIIAERVFEREYCSLEEHATEDLILATKEGGGNKAVRVVGYGDTESLMDLSVLGIANSASKIPEIKCNCSSISCGENEEDEKIPKTILICKNKKPTGLENSIEESSSKMFKENKFINTNDLQQESNVSCILIKCDQSSKDHNYKRSKEKNMDLCPEGGVSKEGISKSPMYRKGAAGTTRPARNCVDHCVAEWLREDVITPCFTYDHELKNEPIRKDLWMRTVISDEASSAESIESSSLHTPEAEYRPDDETLSRQTMPSSTRHSPYVFYQTPNNDSHEMRLTEESGCNAKTSQLVDSESNLNKNNIPSNDLTNSSASDNEPTPSEHAIQK